MHGPSWMVRWAGSHSPAVGVAQSQLSVFIVFSWKIYEDIDRILIGYYMDIDRILIGYWVKSQPRDHS